MYIDKILNIKKISKNEIIEGYIIFFCGNYISNKASIYEKSYFKNFNEAFKCMLNM